MFVVSELSVNVEQLNEQALHVLHADKRLFEALPLMRLWREAMLKVTTRSARRVHLKQTFKRIHFAMPQRAT